MGSLFSLFKCFLRRRAQDPKNNITNIDKLNRCEAFTAHIKRCKNQCSAKTRRVSFKEPRALCAVHVSAPERQILDTDMECPICLGTMQPYVPRGEASPHKVCMLYCHHVFHRDCLRTWLNISKNCPKCRRRVRKYVLI